MRFALSKNAEGSTCGSVTGFQKTLQQMEHEY
jgi:hypothetical protein